MSLMVGCQGSGSTAKLTGSSSPTTTNQPSETLSPIDSAPISVGNIYHSNSYYSLTLSPHIIWSASPSSNVSSYEYSVGTTPGQTNILDWKSNNKSTEVQIANLELQNDSIYYVNVRAVSSTGKLSEVKSSSGWQVQYDWHQEAFLKATNGDATDQFGRTIAISGDTMVIGAPFEDSNQAFIQNGSGSSDNNSSLSSGAAYVFVKSGDAWTQQAYLKASNAGPNDLFGISVAIDGDTIVIGAENESGGSRSVIHGTVIDEGEPISESGAAYVFVRNGDVWSQQAYLKASNADVQDRFGNSVAISKNTIVIGAYEEQGSKGIITNGLPVDDDNLAPLAGAAYVFVRNGDVWSQQAYLKASNAGARDFFGASVAIDENTIVVGAALESSAQNFVTNGLPVNDDNLAPSAGAAYVFVRNGDVWTQQAYLKASNASSLAIFGQSVAISKDTIVVGAPDENHDQNTVIQTGPTSSNNLAYLSGAAYVFKRTENEWTQEAYLKASNNSPNIRFGYSVSISRETIVVGAPFEGHSQQTVSQGTPSNHDGLANQSGAAYVFLKMDDEWNQKAYLKASNAGALDRFGTSTGISNEYIVIGAEFEDSSSQLSDGSDNLSSNSGSAYVFRP